MKTICFLVICLFGIPAAAAGEGTMVFADIARGLSRQVQTGRVNVGVVEFLCQDSNKTTAFSALLRDEIELALSKSPKFRVIARSRIADLQREKVLQTADLLTPGTALPKITVQGVQALVRGRYYIGTKRVTVFAELVWLESGILNKTRVTLPARFASQVLQTPARGTDKANLRDKRTELIVVGQAPQEQGAPGPDAIYVPRMAALMDGLAKIGERISGARIEEDESVSDQSREERTIRAFSEFRFGGVQVCQFSKLKGLDLEAHRTTVLFPPGVLAGDRSLSTSLFILVGAKVRPDEWMKAVRSLKKLGIQVTVKGVADGICQVSIRLHVMKRKVNGKSKYTLIPI